MVAVWVEAVRGERKLTAFFGAGRNLVLVLFRVRCIA